MGGMGSGRRWFLDSKLTVEDCLTLNINKLMRDKFISLHFYRSGSLTWRRVSTGEETGSVGYSAEPLDGDEILLRLNFSITREGEKNGYNQRIILSPTVPNYGGKRWWFICSLYKSGVPCNRRVATLHVPPGGIYFGCRTCYDLTYTSCQDSHKFDRIFAQLANETGLSTKMVKKHLSRDF